MLLRMQFLLVAIATFPVSSKCPEHEPEWPHPHTAEWEQPAVMEIPCIQGCGCAPQGEGNPFNQWVGGGRQEEVDVASCEEQERKWRREQKDQKLMRHSKDGWVELCQ